MRLVPGFAGCVKKFDFSNKDAVIPDTTEMLGYKPPKYYGIGTRSKHGVVESERVILG
jgi:hypothetical protein